MPRHKYPDERGDLYATIYVKMPEALNHDQIEAIEKLFWFNTNIDTLWFCIAFPQIPNQATQATIGHAG